MHGDIDKDIHFLKNKFCLSIVGLFTLISAFACISAAGPRPVNMLGKHVPICGPIKYIQTVPVYTSYGNSAQNVSTTTLSITETAGNLLVATAMIQGYVVPNQQLTVTDTLGHTYYPGPMYFNSPYAATQIFYAPNIQGGANQVTLSSSVNGFASDSTVNLNLIEYSGMATSNVADVTTGIGSGSTTADFSAPSLTSTTACDLVVGAASTGGNWCDNPIVGGAWNLRGWNFCPSVQSIDNAQTGASLGKTVTASMGSTSAQWTWASTAMGLRASNTAAPAQPTQLAFAATGSMSTWTCQAVTLQSQNGSAVPTSTSTGITASLTASAGVGIYADSACAYAISSALIGAGTNSVTIYIQSSTQGSPTISATAAGLTAANQTETVNAVNSFTWIGSAGGSACTTTLKWNTAACWSGGVVPNSTQVAIFDATCTASCNPTLTTINVYGLIMTSDTLANLTQSNRNITVGLGGFQFRGGTFVGATNGTNNLTVNGPLIISGGSFTAPTGSSTLNSIIAYSYLQTGGTFTGSSLAAATTTITTSGGIPTFTLSGGTFNTPAGTLAVQGGWYVNNSPTYNITAGSILSIGNWSRYSVIKPGSLTYGNVTLGAECNRYTWLGGSMNVSGTLTIGGIGGGSSFNTGCGGTFANGTINLTGSLVGGGDGTGYISGTDFKIVLAGNPGGQTITGNAVQLPNINIATGPNPVTLVGNVIVSGYTVTTMGALTSTGSTLNFNCPTNSYCNNSNSTFAPGSFTYNNLTIAGFDNNPDMGLANVTVTGNLLLGNHGYGSQSTLNNGVINVAGDVTTQSYGYGGTASIVLTGNASGQTVNGGGIQLPYLRIATGANPFTLNGNVMVSAYTYTSGTPNLAGSTLTLNCFSWNSDSMCGTTTGIFQLGSITYNNVTISGWQTSLDFANNTMNIGGALNIGDRYNTLPTLSNGTFNIMGGLNVVNYGYGGTAKLQFTGSSAQSLLFGTAGYGTTLLPTGDITVSLTGGGSLNLQNNYSWNSSGQSMMITSGTVLMSGKNLTVNNTLTVNTGAIITKGGGTLTAGTLVNNGTINP